VKREMSKAEILGIEIGQYGRKRTFPYFQKSKQYKGPRGGLGGGSFQKEKMTAIG